MIKSLWEHQIGLKNYVHARYKKQPSSNVLCISPTGSGKSTIAAIIAQKFKNTLIISHRIELINQMRIEFEKHNVKNYLITTPSKALCVFHKYFDSLIIDEAQRSCALTYKNLAFRFRNKMILGLTATPVRTDGKLLGKIYDYFIEGPQIPDLQEIGVLSRTVDLCFPFNIDISDVPISKITYDYEPDYLAHKMRNVKLYGEVIKEFKKNSLNRKNITYCVNIKHAMDMTEYYRNHGLNAVCVSSYTSFKDRMEIYKDFVASKIQILVNCMIYTEGINVPDVSSITSLRPTHSLGLHYQINGRGIRHFPGKKNCLLIDHSGNIQRHGSISDRRDWKYEIKNKKLQKKIIYGEESDNPKKRNIRYKIYEAVDLDYYVNPKRKMDASMAMRIIVETNNNSKTIEEICNQYGYTLDSFILFINKNKGYNKYYSK